MSPDNSGLIDLLVTAIERADTLLRVKDGRQKDIWAEYAEKIKKDPILVPIRDEIDMWNAQASNLAQEIFSPGTLVRVLKNVRDSFYVVERHVNEHVTMLMVCPVMYPAYRRRLPIILSISRNLQIISLEDLDNENLKMSAKRLIARIRLKEL